MVVPDSAPEHQFDTTPANLRRVVLINYLVITPGFGLVFCLMLGSGWLIPLMLILGLCLLAVLWLIVRRDPKPFDWILPVGLVPVLCCAIAAWYLGERGLVFLALTPAAVTLTAVSFPLTTLIAALTGSGLLCLMIIWKTANLPDALAASLIFVAGTSLVARVVHRKSSLYRYARLESLSRNLNDIELTITSSGEILSANDRALSVYGYTAEELIGKHIRLLRAPQEQLLLADQLHEVLTQGHLDFETRHVRKDGSVFPVEVSSFHFTHKNRTYIHSLVRDITLQKKVEDELRRNQIQLQLAISGAGLGLWDWHIQSRRILINHEWASVSGYTLAELEPMTIESWHAMIYPDDQELMSQLIREHFSGRTDEFSAETRIRHKDGSWIWVSYRGKVAEWTPDGMPDRMIGTQENINQRKEDESRTSAMLKEILAQNDLKERLFTILAHDLRGPIGNLNSLLGMAIDGKLGIDELQEALPHLRFAADSAYNLLENILQWVRSSMNEITVLQERIVVDQLLTTVQTWQEPAASAKSIMLLVEPAPQLSILADQRISETILRNLVSNAIKFSPPGSKIVLHASSCPEKQEIVIAVTDEGAGLPPDVMERINKREPAKRSIGTAGEPGSGLGLLFCQDMAERMGSSLHVESTPGQGSRFSLVIPDMLDGDLTAT